MPNREGEGQFQHKISFRPNAEQRNWLETKPNISNYIRELINDDIAYKKIMNNKGENND